MANLRSINLNISSRGLEALRSVDPSLGRCNALTSVCGVLGAASVEDIGHNQC